MPRKGQKQASVDAGLLVLLEDELRASRYFAKWNRVLWSYRGRSPEAVIAELETRIAKVQSRIAKRRAKQAALEAKQAA